MYHYIATIQYNDLSGFIQARDRFSVSTVAFTLSLLGQHSKQFSLLIQHVHMANLNATLTEYSQCGSLDQNNLIPACYHP